MHNEETARWLSKKEICWRLGNGKSILFWEDEWCEYSPFRLNYPRLYHLVNVKGATIAEVVRDGQLEHIEWDNIFTRKLLDMELSSLKEVQMSLKNLKIVNEVHDSIIWKQDMTGKFSVAKLSELLLKEGVEEPNFNFDMI
ncbi:hypothetical protein V6N13_080584 [Hibiscus sabdariffa]